MVLKGVGQEYDSTFFHRHLLEGEFPQFSDSASSNRVVISKSLANKLQLKLGDKIDTYFIQDDVRARRLKIVGIYQTNFSEYDNLFLLTDLYLVNRLNNWEPDQVSGVELEIRDYDKLEETTYEDSCRLRTRIPTLWWPSMRPQCRAAQSPNLCLAGHLGCPTSGSFSF